jgi:hypothetical protein
MPPIIEPAMLNSSCDPAIPLKASVTAIRISFTPRVLRSLNTFIQNFALSVFSIQDVAGAGAR